jgi:GLPGLI family protein
MHQLSCMLSKIFRVLLALPFASLGTEAQVLSQTSSHYQIGYHFRFQVNKTDTNSATSEEMVLNIYPSTSSFMSYNKLLRDSALKQMEITRKFDFRGIARPKLDYLITKDRIAKTIGFYQALGVSKVYYADSLDLFDWQLHPEKKEILGYWCNRATVSFAGRDYTAWYTTAIPIAEGPYKFNGLPGLILEIYDSQNQFHFTAHGIKTTATGDIDNALLPGYVKMTRNEYRTLMEKIRENPSLLFDTDKMKLPPEMLEKAGAGAKIMFEKQNNPIEIY